jgi:hypothetical protein
MLRGPRLLLGVATAVWLLGGVAALWIGLAHGQWLMAQLPPLAIDVAALGGAVVAIGAALVTIAILHAVTVVGLVAPDRWALSVGVLLSTSLMIGLFALATAAGTTLLAGSPNPILLMLAGAGALGGAVLYGWCAVRLVRAIGRASAGDPS